MVKFGRLPKPVIQPPPDVYYDPYVVVQVRIGTAVVDARPFEFDSEAVDSDFRNAQGVQIKPTRYITACPECGHGLELDVVNERLVGQCGNCQAAVVDGRAPVESPAAQAPLQPAIVDPFRNPVKDKVVCLPGHVATDEAADLMSTIANSGKTVAEKLEDDPLASAIDLGDEEEVDEP